VATIDGANGCWQERLNPRTAKGVEVCPRLAAVLDGGTDRQAAVAQLRWQGRQEAASNIARNPIVSHQRRLVFRFGSRPRDRPSRAGTQTGCRPPDIARARGGQLPRVYVSYLYVAYRSQMSPAIVPGTQHDRGLISLRGRDRPAITGSRQQPGNRYPCRQRHCRKRGTTVIGGRRLTDWDRAIARPLVLRVGTLLSTLLGASDFVLALPEDVYRHPAWQRAAGMLTEAVESGRDNDIEEATLQLERALAIENQLAVER
jgi:hypothetical protein